MTEQMEQKMLRNIKLYGIYQTFTKRVFLPLTTIYASEVAGLSIAQIGIASAVATLASILFETTTGFWADKHGRRNSARVGSLFAALGSLLFVLFPSFVGILMAGVVLAIGYAFLSGSMAALIHDSLVTLGRENDFAKVASRAQSFSLVLNAGIIALVPLLYPVDKRLPFVAGMVAFLILFFIANLLTEPPVRHSAEAEERKFIAAVRHVINRKTIWLFAAIGFMYAMMNAPADIYNLSYKLVGLDPHFYGLLFGASSLVAAAFGFVVHHLKRLSLSQFVTLDMSTTIFMFVALGVFHSLTLTIISFLINMTLFRYQRILYSHYLLQIFGNTRYKATLLSLANNFGQVHELFLGLSFTQLGNQVGILNSFNYLIFFALGALVVILLVLSQFRTYSRATSVPVAQ